MHQEPDSITELAIVTRSGFNWRNSLTTSEWSFSAASSKGVWPLCNGLKWILEYNKYNYGTNVFNSLSTSIENNICLEYLIKEKDAVGISS